MIRRPPRSTRTDTLFPYTTLCRSARQPAPIGEGARVLIRVAAVIRRHILRPLAPQRAGELAIIGKVIAAIMELHAVARSEERRVGKECVSTCRSRWSPYHQKTNTKYITILIQYNNITHHTR